MKNRYRKLIKISLPIVLLIVGLLVIGSIKKYGFVKSLKQLVTSETKGQYALNIGDADFELLKLSFELEDIRLTNLDTVKNKGIRSVVLPKISVDLGSLKSFFSFGQIKVESLLLAEPQIEIHPKAKQDSITNFNFTNQLVSMAKGVEAVLNKFEVKDLKIQKANLDIVKEQGKDLRIGLISVLVADWNMRNLQSSARVGVTINNQKLFIGDLAFDFSSIEYRYPEHYLYFNDVNILKEDSVTRTAIKSKSIRVIGLDYEELYKNANYKLRKIEIEEPEISIALSGNKKTKEKIAISDLYPRFKSLIGNAILDSILIHNGKVEINLPNSTVGDIKVFLPKVDFSMSGAFIGNDSISTGFTSLKMRIADASIYLGSLGELNFKYLDFTNKDLLQLDELKFDQGYSSVSIPRIKIEKLKIPTLLSGNLIKAGPITIENPTIKIRHVPAIKIKQQKQLAELLLDLESITIRNGSVDYSLNDLSGKVSGLFVFINRTRFPSPTPFIENIHKIEIANAQLKLKDKLMLASSNVLLTDQTISVKKLSATLDLLKAEVQGINLSDDSFFNVLSTHEIDRVTMEKISLNGELPHDNQDKKPNPSWPIKINELGITTLVANIKNEKGNAKFNGEHIKLNELDSSDPLNFSSIVGKIKNFEFVNSKNSLSFESLSLNSLSSTAILNLKAKADSIQVEIASINTTGIDFKKRAVESSLLKKLRIIGGHHTKGTIDSLRLFDLKMNSSVPFVNDLKIYRPVVSIISKKQEPKENPGSIPDFGKYVKKFSMYDADLNVNRNEISFQSFECGSTSMLDSISGKQLEFQSPTSKIKLASFNYTNHNFTIAQFSVSPIDSLNLQKKSFQKITASVGKSRLQGLDINNLLKGDINIDSAFFENIELTILKDKRLGAPPQFEKPFLLSSMIPKGAKIAYSSFSDMDLHYHEISANTGLTGIISLTNLKAVSKVAPSKNSDFSGLNLTASTQLYNQGTIEVDYKETTKDEFIIDVAVSDLDLTELNKIIVPLQGIEIKNGKLRHTKMHAVANPEMADATASMTYNDLHIAIRKNKDPEQSTLGTELLTLLADGIILKHSRTDAKTNYTHQRIKEKAIFNYWVKSVIHGSMSIIRHGNSKKK